MIRGNLLQEIVNWEKEKKIFFVLQCLTEFAFGSSEIRQEFWQIAVDYNWILMGTCSSLSSLLLTKKKNEKNKKFEKKK